MEKRPKSDSDKEEREVFLCTSWTTESFTKKSKKFGALGNMGHSQIKIHSLHSPDTSEETGADPAGRRAFGAMTIGNDKEGSNSDDLWHLASTSIDEVVEARRVMYCGSKVSVPLLDGDGSSDDAAEEDEEEDEEEDDDDEEEPLSDARLVNAFVRGSTLRRILSIFSFHVSLTLLSLLSR